MVVSIIQTKRIEKPAPYMSDKLLSTKVIEDILNQTLSALEDGRSQIFEVAETARKECDRTAGILEAVRSETQQAIVEVESLEKAFARIRSRLYVVNKDFQDYDDDVKKQVYEEAARIREELAAGKERERVLRIRRDGLEQTFVRLQDIALKAERLVAQVGVALTYLSTSIHDVNEQVEQIQAREQVGQKILQVQEIERKRMAGALHDGPVQDLAHLVVQMEICEQLFLNEDYDEARKSLSLLKDVARGCMGDMRRIIYDLNPMTLDDLGLVATVKNVLDHLQEQTGVITNLRVFGEEFRLKSEIEVGLFRIIQEALNNSRKHAQARQIEVTIEFLARFVNVEIRDNGLGFDFRKIQEKLKTGKHYGLLSIQNRANLFNGSTTIRSKPDEGTRILVRVPLNGGRQGGLL